MAMPTQMQKEKRSGMPRGKGIEKHLDLPMAKPKGSGLSRLMGSGRSRRKGMLKEMLRLMLMDSAIQMPRGLVK